MIKIKPGDSLNDEIFYQQKSQFMVVEDFMVNKLSNPTNKTGYIVHGTTLVLNHTVTVMNTDGHDSGKRSLQLSLKF